MAPEDIFPICEPCWLADFSATRTFMLSTDEELACSRCGGDATVLGHCHFTAVAADEV